MHQTSTQHTTFNMKKLGNKHPIRRAKQKHKNRNRTNEAAINFLGNFNHLNSLFPDFFSLWLLLLLLLKCLLYKLVYFFLFLIVNNNISLTIWPFDMNFFALSSLLFLPIFRTIIMVSGFDLKRNTIYHQNTYTQYTLLLRKKMSS